MTDTVNVPREWLDRLKDCGWPGDLRREIDAKLAAAPKAEPVSETSVVPCPQCEGEGEYADGLDEAACSTTCTRCKGNGWLVDLTTQTEAPKVEQEPVDINAVCLEEALKDPDWLSKWNSGVNPHTHPAPASDELLDRIHSWLVCAPMVSDVTEYHEMAAQFVEEIAEHKGPQS